MFRHLLKKYLHESIYLWLACGVMLVIFPWVRIWTVSQFELSGFAPLLNQIRVLEKFSPVPLEQFLTYDGVVGLTFDEPVLILCIVVWCIARGTDFVSGEVGRGTMEMLLAQPVSREKIALAHASVTILGLLGLVAMTFLGLALGIHTCSVPVTVDTSSTISIPGLPFAVSNPFERSEPIKTFQPLAELVSVWTYLPVCINLFCFGLVILGLSIFFGSWDQYRWRTIGLVIGTYVLQLLLFVLSKATPSMKPLMNFSFFAAYQPDWIVQVVKSDPTFASKFLYTVGEATHIGPMGFSAILALLGTILYAFGTVIFLRRDIPAPL